MPILQGLLGMINERGKFQFGLLGAPVGRLPSFESSLNVSDAKVQTEAHKFSNAALLQEMQLWNESSV